MSRRRPGAGDGRSVDYARFDRVVVDRLIGGQPPGQPIGAAEAAEVVRLLARRCYSDGQIALVLGCHRRSVIRIRRRRGIAAGVPRGSNQGYPGVPTRARAAN